jgi:hypothetical protein
VSSYDAALAIVDKLTAAGVRATADPRSATPPCVLVPPPDRVYDIGCGYTARWRLVALVPNPGNADAHKALDALADSVAGVLPVERMNLTRYSLASDGEPLPAITVEFDEGVS